MWHLLQQDPGPDAVFAASDQMAIGAMAAIHESGLRVPEDIALVGFDDIGTAPPNNSFRECHELSPQNRGSIFHISARRRKTMTEMFKFCILFEEAPGRDLAQISPGWEMAEIPVALMVKPFESAANWSQQRQVIASWSQLPPIKASSHFLQFWGLTPTGPGVDWDQLEFWTERAFARLADLGVEVVKGDQPLELIAEEPDYCLHVHIAGDHGQPGVGDLDDVFMRLFRILRDCGYTRGVSAACPWVSTDGGEVDFGKETAKSLAYLKALRDKVYAE
jgi:hypothetical protein